MTKQLRSSFPQRAWTLLAILALAGCGAESTNIQGGGSGTGNACSGLSNTVCVTGRLVDDAAANINYECGLSSAAMIRSVTASDGTFSCPNGSVATFSLINPDAPDNKIVLGTVTITLPAQLNGENPAVPVYQYVTPQILSGEYSGMGLTNRAINIARLLQTLSTDTIDADLTRNLPSRRVIISDDDKRKINTTVLPDGVDFAMAPAVDPVTPIAGTFDAAMKAYMEAVGKFPLISRAKGETVLRKGINATVAGVFLVPGNSLLYTGSLTPGNEEADADNGAMVGYDATSGKSFVGTFQALVDRRGRMLTSGVYSYGVPVGTDPWAVYSDPQPMVLTNSGYSDNTFHLWPFDGKMSTFQLKLLGSTDVGKFVSIHQGSMRREAVAGSSKLYTQLFGETSAPSDLGRWALDNGSGSVTYIPGGAYTLEHSTPVATWMNPDVWNDSVITFPLPITVSLYNQDYANSSCLGGRGCKMADIRMVILEDGNIISDRNHTCGAGVDPDTLLVSGDTNLQEIPLGVVASAQNELKDETGSSLQVLNLLAMLPDDPRLADTMTVVTGFEPYLTYAQFSSNSRGTSFLRVDGGADQYQSYGKCTATLVGQGLCTVSSRPASPDEPVFQPRIGGWINNYTTARALKAGMTAPSDPATQALARNAGGYMQVRKTTAGECVAPP